MVEVRGREWKADGTRKTTSHFDKRDPIGWLNAAPGGKVLPLDRKSTCWTRGRTMASEGDAVDRLEHC